MAHSAVLAQYPSAVAGLTWVPLGNAGGFSGASIWRGEAAGEPLFCLKAWLPGYPTERLLAVHHWMRLARDRSAGEVVPAVVPIARGGTIATHGGQVWDMTAWMPGTADYATHPSDAKLTAACATIAVLHRSWASEGITHAPCPGVRRRLEVMTTLAARLMEPAHPDPLSRELIHRATVALRTLVPEAVAALRAIADRPVPIFPCLCDVWHDHILYTGDRVSGVIDYGAMKVDHPAVDLARLLGDLVGADREKWAVGLTAYRDAGGPIDLDAEFVELLDRTGIVGGLIHWLRRLAGHGPPVTDEVAARARLSQLLGRVNTG